MPWAISFTSNFLNTLLSLPEAVKNQFSRIIELLENDPRPNLNPYLVKIKNRKLYRAKLTRKYRLFYKYGEGWVKLIDFRTRDNDTYLPEVLNKMAEEDIPCILIDDEEIEENLESTPCSGWLSEIQLQRWRVPENYWPDLLQIQNGDEERLLQVLEQINNAVVTNRILDNLFPQPLDELSERTEYVTAGENTKEFFRQYITGQKEVTDIVLKLSREQQKILELEGDRPILVKGGPGTGKSVLALHRTARLAKARRARENGKILFTTYNQALINYSKQLLNPLLDGKPPEDFQIDVKTVDKLAIEY